MCDIKVAFSAGLKCLYCKQFVKIFRAHFHEASDKSYAKSEQQFRGFHIIFRGKTAET